MGEPADELVLEIMRALEIDWQWLGFYAPDDTDSIARARSAGRKAGRQLGMKVRTYATKPGERRDGRVLVIVAMNEDSDDVDPDERERMEDRFKTVVNDPSFGQS